MFDIVNRITGFFLSFSIPAFYSKIQGKNIHYLFTNKPVIIAMNHPNAFTDPIALNFLTRPKLGLKYLARGDAFKPGIATFFLEQFGIVPIFRIQDGGKEGLKKNNDSYKRVNELLKKNNKIIVFAEGLCIQERRLRPLKKGVPRMVFGAFDFLKTKNLEVIPIAVNYSKPNKKGSTIFYNVGEPIKISDYESEYKEQPAKTYNKFLQDLEPKMKKLMVQINNSKYDNLVEEIETLITTEELKLNNYKLNDLEQRFYISQKIANKINQLESDNPTHLDLLLNKSENYFNQLKKIKLKDWLINPINKSKTNPFYITLLFLSLFTTAPLALISFIANSLPFNLTHIIVKKIIKNNKEFYSSLFIAFSLFLFIINYIIWFIISYSFLNNVWAALTLIAIFILCGYFTNHYIVYFKKFVGTINYHLASKQIKHLKQLRKELVSLFNEF